MPCSARCRGNARPALLISAGIGAALLVLAFIAAPKSCEWGLTTYVLSGGAGLLILFALPFALRSHESMLKRVGLAFGLAALGFGVWVAGFAAANIRIMCRLF